MNPMSAVAKHFRPGEMLFKEGQNSDSMFVVQKGTVAIRKTKGSGYIEIARVYTNEVIGELSFFDRLPRSASAVALTEVDVLQINFDSLDKIYAGIPDYFKTIMACVADRLRKANDTIRRLQKNVSYDEKRRDDDEEEETESASDVLSSLESSSDGDEESKE